MGPLGERLMTEPPEYLDYVRLSRWLGTCSPWELAAAPAYWVQACRLVAEAEAEAAAQREG